MKEPVVEVSVKLTEGQMRAFSEFVRQAGYSDYRQFAVSAEQAYDMLHAGESLRSAFRKAEPGE